MEVDFTIGGESGCVIEVLAVRATLNGNQAHDYVKICLVS